MWQRRLTIPDARGHGAVLRVTRHPEQHKVVVSHWREDLCVASTPIELSELPTLIGVLADPLGDAVRSSEVPPPSTPHETLLHRFKQWLRPRLAQIIELRTSRDTGTQKKAG